ncbi:heavy metal translocating P-type ATPase [Rhodovulum sulfidophilum]|uniref:heavy metal translocating P-type ATPase n=1 Tax=Rhodovulum sulfidophilum TaxID=35806 RepID=UPI0009510CFC|nr:cation-translocating P-type ATPase [Rhodovulum sulfidophilum]MBL3551588.1 cadmium-translocating P-type ATPase [Rhodovulum sulfidophilum]OLS49054.1 cadmium-translocating P-type ATPase [Rhodovulum sulfidophilum]
MPTRSEDARRLILTGVTLAGMLTAAALHWGPFPGTGWPHMAAMAALALVYTAGGIPAGARALHALWTERALDIDLLMVIAALAAAAVGATAEGAVLLTLFSLSTTLEHRAIGRARRAIEALMELRPDRTLRRRVSGDTEEVAVADLAPGDIVILRPGARVPVDGTIREGEGAIDESTITGESVPVHKQPGAQVFEATVNLHGVLAVEVTRPLAESTVARMIALVTEAQAARAPSERFSEWFGQRYTIAVLAGAVLAFAAFLWLGLGWHAALYKAATLLVAASPCAIVISVPAAILSALSASARGGVLFKGGAALETLARVDSFAFDKTGTLTTGRQEVVELACEGDPDIFLARLAGLEAHSEHPIADAIRRAATARGLSPLAVREARAVPGEGMVGVDDEGVLWAGNERLAARMGAKDAPSERSAPIGDLDRRAQTLVLLGRGARYLGAVTVEDQPRPTARPGLDALRARGIARLAMLTGDRRAVAERIGAELGIAPAEIHAELRPEDKLRIVAGLARSGRVAFVGDGVNDAAALARADIGIAMGAAGSEVALQAADVALLSEDLGRLAAAHALARRTARIIRQNLIFAMGAMAVLVASGILFDLPLPVAVVGHEGGTVLVVLNGLRLLADPIRHRSAA